jgi:hypothetical protein
MRAAVTLAACGLVGATSGCIEAQCNVVDESSISLGLHVEDPLAAVEGSSLRLCLNATCSTGMFGTAGSPTGANAELDGPLGWASATLASDPNGSLITFFVNGGNGRYADGDMWAFSFAEPGGGGADASTTAHYLSRDQPCDGPGTYQTLSVVVYEAP